MPDTFDASTPNPVELNVVGDQYVDTCRIGLVIWEGSTTVGDTCELRDPKTGKLLWPGRTDVTNTYLGVSMMPFGIHAPNGFRLTKLDSGRLMVYIQRA